jgi:uncharacterized protein YxjI
MRFPLDYPLSLNFKIVALAPQLSVTDASGSVVAYVKQKLLKIKEDITVYEDLQKTIPAFNMKADRVIDFSPRFTFVDTTSGQTLGSVKRQGARSLWRAHYDTFAGETLAMQISEENPWVKAWDALVGDIPVVGMFSGYMFHPAYLVKSLDGQVLMRMEKRPAFFEGKFAIERKVPLSPEEEKRAFLSLVMMVLMERARG